jgi:hypothetical protein
MKGLTFDEARLLVGFEMRRRMSQAFAGKDTEIAGKTVGELLVGLKKQAEDGQREEEKQTRLAKDAKAKADAIAAEIRKSIGLTVYEKEFLPSNYSAGRYNDLLIIKCAYENTSAKDIRAFKGAIEFTDLFGADIYTSSLTISDPVKAGQKGNWIGNLHYNQFKSDEEHLRNTDLKDMKVIWKPTSVIFADDTRLGVAQ